MSKAVLGYVGLGLAVATLAVAAVYLLAQAGIFGPSPVAQAEVPAQASDDVGVPAPGSTPVWTVREWNNESFLCAVIWQNETIHDVQCYPNAEGATATPGAVAGTPEP